MGILKKGDKTIELVIKVVEKEETKTIEIELPEEFASAKNIYNFQVNEDLILFSCDVSDSGIWGYKISNNSFEQLYLYEQNWKYFQKSDNDVIISTSDSFIDNPLLLYDSETNEISSLISYSYSNWGYFHEIPDGFLISSNGGYGIIKYEKNTKTAELIYSSGTEWNVSKNINEGTFLSSFSSDGILFYNNSLKNISIMYNSGKNWKFYQIGNKTFISSDSSSSSDRGLLLFENIETPITKISESGYGKFNYTTINDDMLFSYFNSSNSGVLYFDNQNKTVEKLYSTGYNWQYFIPFESGILMSNLSSSYKGLLLFDADNKTISQIFTNYYRFNSSIDLGNEILMGGSFAYGLFVFDKNLKTLTQLTTSTNYLEFFKTINGALAIATTSTAIYNSNSKTVKSYSGFYSMTNLKYFDNNDILMGTNSTSTTDNPLGLYKSETDEIIGLSKLGKLLDTFIDTDEGVIIKSSDMTINPIILYYDINAQIASVSGYVIEV